MFFINLVACGKTQKINGLTTDVSVVLGFNELHSNSRNDHGKNAYLMPYEGNGETTGVCDGR